MVDLHQHQFLTHPVAFGLLVTSTANYGRVPLRRSIESISVERHSLRKQDAEASTRGEHCSRIESVMAAIPILPSPFLPQQHRRKESGNFRGRCRTADQGEERSARSRDTAGKERHHCAVACAEAGAAVEIFSRQGVRA